MSATDTDPRHVDALGDLVAHIRDQYPRLSDDADSWDVAAAILGSTDPAVHAAMLDALTRHGVLTEEHDTQQAWNRHPAYHARRLVTSWEVAP